MSGEEQQVAPLGVLFTGFMEKQNPAMKAKWGKRFLVLTYESFYWFKRKENYELFGEERGCIALKDLKTVRALHDANHTFEIEDRSKNKRYFRPVKDGEEEHRDEQTEEWITAIRSAMKHQIATSSKEGSSAPRRKRATLSMKKFKDPAEMERERLRDQQVNVQLFSVVTAAGEIVIKRNPDWQEIVTLPLGLSRSDTFIISTSNGGSVQVSKEMLEEKSMILSDGVDNDNALSLANAAADDHAPSGNPVQRSQVGRGSINSAGSPQNGYRSPSRKSSASDKYKTKLRQTLARTFREKTGTEGAVTREPFEDVGAPASPPLASSSSDSISAQAVAAVRDPSGGDAITTSQRPSHRGSRVRTSSAALEALLNRHNDHQEISEYCFAAKVDNVPIPSSVYMFVFRDEVLDILEERAAADSAGGSSPLGSEGTGLVGWTKVKVSNILSSNISVLLILLLPYLWVVRALILESTSIGGANFEESSSIIGPVPLPKPSHRRAMEVSVATLNLTSPPLWLSYVVTLLCMSLTFPWLFKTARQRLHTTDDSDGGRSRARTVSRNTSSSFFGDDVEEPQEVVYRLVLLGYSFTSEDNPVEHVENTLPDRFATCEPTEAECRRRWDLTRHWRETEGINTILTEPHPNFHYCKYFYPHYHAGRGKDGHLVYYERPGELDLKSLKEKGIDSRLMMRHWLFVTEYQWEIMCADDDNATAISVIDVKGVSVFDLMGATLDFVRQTISTANVHYPGRAYKVYIINCTSTFTTIFGLIKGFISAATLDKIKLCGTNQEEILTLMSECIERDQIPEYYGGGLKYEGYAGKGGNDSCRYNSPFVTELNQFVERIPGQKADGFDHSQHPTLEEFQRWREEVRANDLAGRGVGLQDAGYMQTPVSADIGAAGGGSSGKGSMFTSPTPNTLSSRNGKSVPSSAKQTLQATLRHPESLSTATSPSTSLSGTTTAPSEGTLTPTSARGQLYFQDSPAATPV